MAQTDANIAVKIGADLSPLERDMARASKRVSSFSRKIKAQSKQMAKYGAAAAAAGTAVLVAFYKNGSKAIDAQAKLAKTLNATHTEIAALNRASSLSGLEFKRVQRALSDFNKRLGEAQSGMGPAAKELDKLGLSAHELARLPLNERLSKIAAEVNKLGTASERAASLGQLMEGGRNLTNLFEGGAEALRSATNEVIGFGIALSDVDAAKVEQANDAMSGIGDAFTGIRNQFTVAVAPILAELGTQFTDAAKQTGGFKNEISAAVETTLRGFARVGDVMRGVQVAYAGLKVAALAVGEATWNGMKLAGSAISSLIDGALAGINLLIRGVNSISSLIGMDDIPEFESSKAWGFFQGLTSIQQQANENLEQAKTAFMELAMQPLPSDNINEFFEAVKTKSQETAEKVVGDRTKMFGIDPEKSEEEAQLAQDKITALEGINAQGLDSISRLTEKKYGENSKHALNSMSTILKATSTHSKKAFKLQKAAAIGEAVVNTYKGVSASLSAYPMPVAAIMAAAHLAMGLQQVNAIKSQSFGGGGGGGGGALSSGSAAAGAAAQAAPAQQKSQPENQIVNIDLQGEVFGRDQVRGLIGQINEALDDGFTLRV